MRALVLIRPALRASRLRVFSLLRLPAPSATCVAMDFSAAALRAWVAEMNRREREDSRPLVRVSQCKHLFI